MQSSNIADEFRTIMSGILATDPAFTSLQVAGSSPETLTWAIEPGNRPVGEYSQPPRREIIGELVDRMLKLRWRRLNAATGMIIPPSRDDLDGLRGRYPAFPHYPDHGPGWTDLSAAMLEWIGSGGDGSWGITDAKEKYGYMSLFFSGDTGPLGDEIIEATELVSEHVCDVCGAPGRLRSKGWMMTRCDEHTEKKR